MSYLQCGVYSYASWVVISLDGVPISPLTVSLMVSTMWCLELCPLNCDCSRWSTDFCFPDGVHNVVCSIIIN